MTSTNLRTTCIYIHRCQITHITSHTQDGAHITCCAIVCAVWKSLDSDSATGAISKSFISAASVLLCAEPFTLSLSAGRFTLRVRVFLPTSVFVFVFSSALSVARDGCLARSCCNFSALCCATAFWDVRGGTDCCHDFWDIRCAILCCCDFWDIGCATFCCHDFWDVCFGTVCCRDFWDIRCATFCCHDFWDVCFGTVCRRALWDTRCGTNCCCGCRLTKLCRGLRLDCASDTVALTYAVLRRRSESAEKNRVKLSNSDVSCMLRLR